MGGRERIVEVQRRQPINRGTAIDRGLSRERADRSSVVKAPRSEEPFVSFCFCCFVLQRHSWHPEVVPKKKLPRPRAGSVGCRGANPRVSATIRGQFTVAVPRSTCCCSSAVSGCAPAPASRRRHPSRSNTQPRPVQTPPPSCQPPPEPDRRAHPSR